MVDTRARLSSQSIIMIRVLDSPHSECDLSLVPLSQPFFYDRLGIGPTLLGVVGHVGGTAVRGCDDLAARSAFIISFFPSREDLLEAPDKGAEDEVLCLTAVVDPTEQELGDCTVARVDPTEHELGNCDVARVDPTEQELGNCDVARVDPTEHELGNSNVARVDPTEHELGNWDIARVDPTEQEFGNCNVARVDPTEHELGNSNVARVDLTKHELRNCDVALLPRVKSGANPEIWP
ncbi:hypothetical protein BHE74_00053188 [Ensete ventricosum]|nr:hypothetical protein BHE74_00053188 [Ensete ventricosum]